MTPKEILLAAATLLETKGWTQGEFKNDYNGKCCALGAINRSTKSNELSRVTCGHLQVYLNGSVIVWNDHPDRTAAEVTATLRACAETL